MNNNTSNTGQNNFLNAGINISHCDSVEDILNIGKIDFEVYKTNIYEKSLEGYTKIPNTFALHEDHTHSILGIVNNNYKIVQNKEAFNYIKNINGFTPLKAGCSKTKQVSFISGKLDNKIFIEENKDDVIDQYLTFIHGQNGKTGIRIFITPFRVTCQNMMNFCIKNNLFSRSLIHKGDIDTKIVNTIRNIEDLQKKYIDSFKKEISIQINTKISEYTANKAVVHLFPNVENNKKLNDKNFQRGMDIIDLYNNKPDLQNYKGTMFGLVSAVSDYVSNRPIKQTKDCYNNFLIRTVQKNAMIDKTIEFLKETA